MKKNCMKENDIKRLQKLIWSNGKYQMHEKA